MQLYSTSGHYILLYLKIIYLDQPANSKQSGTVFIVVPFSKAIPEILIKSANIFH
jgi:hypothetical protein